jgi:L,D-transpeptidase YbiS
MMIANTLRIEVDISQQTLRLYSGNDCLKSYPVSTARNGAGEQMDSECTPRGEHVIAEKVGAGCEPGTVFVARQPTGEIYSEELRRQSPERDWILTRILWLAGAEPGRNQGAEVDSQARYIYIHGTPDDVDMNVRGSRGCVRMRNADIIELFELIETGTPVLIKD